MADVANISNGNNSQQASTASPDPLPDSPTPQSPTTNPAHDLPVELLTAGWRKFWSKREQRPYYFNRNTNVSRWDPPTSPDATDTIADPLGIAHPPERNLSDVRLSRPSVDIPVAGDKRPASTTLQKSGISSPPKKPLFNNYCPYWNFQIHTNVTVMERPHCMMPPPHPEVEMLRSQMTVKLRVQYEEMCRTREGIESPQESFNRWLLERAVIDGGEDPMLPSKCVPDVSQSMYREIINEIPLKLTKAMYSNEMRKQLLQYAEAAKRMIEKRAVTPNSRKMVLYNVDENIAWLRKTTSASYSDYLERLTYLKRQCQPHLTEAAKISVEGICSKMYNMSCECVKKIHEQHWTILKENNIQRHEHPAKVKGIPRKFLCYPLPLAYQSPKLPIIEHTVDGDTTFLCYKGDSMKLNTSHFCKLEQLYKLSCTDDVKFEKFLARAWCMLKRYRTYFGMTDQEGPCLQGALPLPVFECLHRVFGVAFECFASPLNCYFKQYCSAFSDTDGFFGSRGLGVDTVWHRAEAASAEGDTTAEGRCYTVSTSNLNDNEFIPSFNIHVELPILNLRPLSGSFEANPPFCEELMEAMVDHFERSSFSVTLSIVIIYTSASRTLALRRLCTGALRPPTTMPWPPAYHVINNLLEETSEPLSFIIFIPEWRDPPTEAQIRLDSSRFKRHSLVLPAKQHEYRHGFQHDIKSENHADLHLVAAHGTTVIFIQNDAGFNQWTPTSERVQELVNASKVKPQSV